jgi:hypothetical protein
MVHNSGADDGHPETTAVPETTAEPETTAFPDTTAFPETSAVPDAPVYDFSGGELPPLPVED